METEMHCLNCLNPLGQEDRYCYHCGQRIEPLRPKFSELVVDVLRNTYSFDSRTWRTLRLLVMPARLTTAYFEGRREQFINPVRLFLFGVIVHLAIINFFISPAFLGPDQMDKQASKTLNALSVGIETSKEQKRKLETSSSVSQDRLAAIDSLIVDLQQRFDSINSEGQLRLGLQWISDKPIILTQYDRAFSSADSIIQKNNIRGFAGKLIINQLLKLDRNPRSFGSFLVGRISWLIFLLMPLLSVVMWFLYLRRHHFFVEHLIFTVHYHVFGFLMVSLGIILDYFTGVQLIPVSLLGTLLYIYLGMLHFYGQNRTKTFFKFVMLMSAYFWIAVFVTVILLIAGFLLFN
ncbi:MAG: DUF3667 domain-containing protein [Saprospiraceae bacterium]|nr:DUF3667 domain-containing protein [Saprospiraceae bacterium]